MQKVGLNKEGMILGVAHPFGKGVVPLPEGVTKEKLSTCSKSRSSIKKGEPRLEALGDKTYLSLYRLKDGFLQFSDITDLKDKMNSKDYPRYSGGGTLI